MLYTAQKQQKRRSSMHEPMHPRLDADGTAPAESEGGGEGGEAAPSLSAREQMFVAQQQLAAVSRGRDMAARQKMSVSSRFLQSTQSVNVKKRQREEPVAPARPASGERKLTIPVAPNLRSVSRSRDRMQSTEEKEMQKLEEERQLELERKRRNQRSMEYNKAKSNMPVHNVVRSTKPLTIPTTPYNNLSKRHGTKTYSTTYVTKPEVRPRSAPATGPKQLTQPEPFVLMTSLRAGSSQGSVEAVPTAGELCRQFEADPRSHRVPNAATRLTEAQSPMLRTKTRATSTGRPLPRSYEQTEEQLMAEAGKNQWRAKPVDKRVFDSHGELGVPKVAAKPMTVCEEFTFSYNEERVLQRRQAALASKEKEEEDQSAFKAAPMPDWTRAAAAAPHVTKPLTICLSPKLSGGRRSSSAPARRQRPHHDEVERERRQREAAEALRSRRPMMLTDPQGFHLSTTDRGKMNQAMLAQRLEEEKAQEQRQRDFKAHKFNDARTFVPQPSNKGLTDFTEFHLQSDDRHAAAASKREREEDLRLAEEIASKRFHARAVPNAVVNPEAAFKVHKSEKPTTHAVAMSMATDERVKKRNKFVKEMNRRKQEQARVQAQLETEKDRDEIENLNQLRRKPIAEGGMCFKAAPRPGAKTAAGEEPMPAREAGLSDNQVALLEQSLNSFAAVVPASEGL
jgi:hypothetical protein